MRWLWHCSLCRIGKKQNSLCACCLWMIPLPLLSAAMSHSGVSVKYGYDMNSLAVPRKAKESIGGIAALRKPDGGTLTINVEYNLLDPLLRASGWADGDVNDDSGYSPYPGEDIFQLTDVFASV